MPFPTPAACLEVSVKVNCANQTSLLWFQVSGLLVTFKYSDTKYRMILNTTYIQKNATLSTCS